MKNDLGVDPDEWFRESIPLSEDPPNTSNYQSGLPTNRYHPDEDYAPCEYEPPMQDSDWFIDKPKDKVEEKEEEKTMHQKMYEIATARYNPFSLGGSENCDSDISCNIGGSENIQKS